MTYTFLDFCLFLCLLLKYSIMHYNKTFMYSEYKTALFISPCYSSGRAFETVTLLLYWVLLQMSLFTTYQLQVFTAAPATAAGLESTTWYQLFALHTGEQWSWSCTLHCGVSQAIWLLHHSYSSPRFQLPFESLCSSTTLSEQMRVQSESSEIKEERNVCGITAALYTCLGKLT